MKVDIDLSQEHIKDRKNENIFNQENHNNFIKASYEHGDIIKTKTPLQEFYKDACIFLTGGTGFLGKVLIEKLLRSCPDICRIYVLIRPKKGKNMADRILELLKDPIFYLLKQSYPEFEKKIVGIPGDCSTANLGLISTDKNTIINEVSIVFHVAATVRFDEPLTVAIAINVQSTACILDMCKSMHKLKSFVHVSTAYANCFSLTIEEKFYDYSVHYEDFLELQKLYSEENINKTASKLTSLWPNTYTFTKALAEDLIRNKNKDLPMGIFRPGIITSTAKEPVAGWIDNYYGPTGIVAGCMAGVVRTMQCDPDKIANIIPVDLTVNALIASAWDIATQVDRRDDKMLIYNFTSTVDAPMTWGMLAKNALTKARNHPSSNAIWYFMLFLQKSKLIYYGYIFFLHWIPALVLDFIAMIMGEKPRLRKTYQKVHKLVHALSHFSTNEWKFTNDNVQNMWQLLDSRDREMFNFSMHNFNWQSYFVDYVKGVRTYLLKDDVRTLEEDKEKSRRLYWNHQLLTMLLVSFGCWCIWKIFTMTLA